MSLSGAGFAKGAVANLNLAFGAECAVDAMTPTAAGFHDVFGNLWQVRCAALCLLGVLWWISLRAGARCSLHGVV